MRNEDIYLGVQPETLRVFLTAGADFYCVLRAQEPWPVGASIKLEVGASTWTATISGADATFNVDKAVWTTVDDDAIARLVYTNGSVDQVWAHGKVVRRG